MADSDENSNSTESTKVDEDMDYMDMDNLSLNISEATLAPRSKLLLTPSPSDEDQVKPELESTQGNDKDPNCSKEMHSTTRSQGDSNCQEDTERDKELLEENTDYEDAQDGDLNVNIAPTLPFTSVNPEVESEPQESLSKMDNTQDKVVRFINNEAKVTPVPMLQYVLDVDQPYDTIITCADGKIGVHRLVLSIASHFVGAMFDSFSHRLGEIATLILPDIRLQIMKTLLNFCYTGRMVFAQEDETEVLNAMKMLQIGVHANITLKEIKKPPPPEEEQEQNEEDDEVPELSSNKVDLHDEGGRDSELTTDTIPHQAEAPRKKKAKIVQLLSSSSSVSSIEDSCPSDDDEKVNPGSTKTSKKSSKKSKPSSSSSSQMPTLSSMASIFVSPGSKLKPKTTTPVKNKPKEKEKPFKKPNTPKPSNSKEVPTVLAMLQKASLKRKRNLEENPAEREKNSSKENFNENLKKRQKLDSAASSASTLSKSKALSLDSKREKTHRTPLATADVSLLQNGVPSYETFSKKKGKQEIKYVNIDVNALPRVFVKFNYGKTFIYDLQKSLRQSQEVIQNDDYDNDDEIDNENSGNASAGSTESIEVVEGKERSPPPTDEPCQESFLDQT